jgi:hypothetical protein
MMLYKLLLYLCFFQILNGFAQTKVEGTSYTHFQLKTKKDTIDFVIADTNLNQVKPLLLFCQGSQPIPLFFDLDEQGIIPVPLSNFDLDELNKHYHVAVISMPKTPLIVGRCNLNKQYAYVTDTIHPYSYSVEFLKADYLENYVFRANEVIKFLLKQSWISSDEVVVAGHSQGSKIAVGIAASNKKVSQVGLFGYNPFGRIDQLIRQARKSAEAEEISWEKADSIQQEQYDFYKLIQNSDTIKAHPSLVAWESFTKPTLNELLRLKVPLYIAYGSQDIIADFCDLLPLYFIEQGKHDYVLKRYANLEHNFFPVDENGRVNYSEGKWRQVMQEFLDWSRREPTKYK